MIFVAVSKRVFGNSHLQLHSFGVQQPSFQDGPQFCEAVLGYKPLAPYTADQDRARKGLKQWRLTSIRNLMLKLEQQKAALDKLHPSTFC